MEKNKILRKCWKMDRECISGCIAYRSQYSKEELDALFENHSKEKRLPSACFGQPLLLTTPDGAFVGETNCFDLYLYNQKILLKADKIKRGKKE